MRSRCAAASRIRGWRPTAALGWALVCWTALPVRAEVSFELHVGTDSAELGDPIRLILECGDPGFDPAEIIAIEFLNLNQEQWHVASDWQAMDRDPKAESPARWSATIQGFDLGGIDPPGVRVSYRAGEGGIEEAELKAPAMQITGVVDRGEAQAEQLYGLRPLYAFPVDWRFWSWVGLGALVIAASAFFLLGRWLSRRAAAAPAAPAEPPLPPGVWALGEIDRLRALPLNQSGPVKQIATLASDVVRTYLGRRFGFTAMEMTTHECMQALRALGVSGEIERMIRHYLDGSDRVKFTKFAPPPDQWAAFWDDARALIVATTPPAELNRTDRGRTPLAPAAAEAS